MFVLILNQGMLKKISRSMIDEHVKKPVPYSGECEYELDYRSKVKNKQRGAATIYHPPLNKNHKKEFEKDG